MKKKSIKQITYSLNMNPAQRESTRQKDANARRILDEAARRRRARKALEALEQDNFHDDPHANLVLSKKIPKFEESLDGKQSRRRKSKNFENFKQRYSFFLFIHYCF